MTTPTEEQQRLALLEARVSAQFSLIMAAYKVMLRKGLVSETLNQVSATLQASSLQLPELPESVRLDIDAHLAEFRRLRHFLEG